KVTRREKPRHVVAIVACPNCQASSVGAGRREVYEEFTVPVRNTDPTDHLAIRFENNERLISREVTYNTGPVDGRNWLAGIERLTGQIRGDGQVALQADQRHDHRCLIPALLPCSVRRNYAQELRLVSD